MHPRRHQGARNQQIGQAINARTDGPKPASDGKVDQLERQTRGQDLDGRTHSSSGNDGNKEAPGLAWRGSNLQAKFQRSVTAVRAGQVILREGLAANVKPGISEIAHVEPFRVVKTTSIQRAHTLVSATALRIPDLYTLNLELPILNLNRCGAHFKSRW